MPKVAEHNNILGVFPAASSHWVGDGFPVRTVFPTRGAENLDPFLMLDYAGPAHFDPSTRPRGVEQHPHRGFETVTIAYQGSVDHRDSAGNAGSIHPGDVQWMTAASGVLHEEKHSKEFTARGGDFEMAQLWVNLPAAYKMSKPKYQTLLSAAIPHVDLGPGASARIIAGELGGARGPAQTFTPVSVFDLRLEAAARGTLALPAGQRAALVLLRGRSRLTAPRCGARPRLLLSGRTPPALPWRPPHPRCCSCSPASPSASPSPATAPS